MNQYIGKKLSEIALANIANGTRVANVDREEGIVRFTVPSAKEIHVDWDNGSWTRYKEGDCGETVVVETTNYSGKPLSQMPYDKINIGLDVISYKNTPGKVIEKRIIEHRNGNEFIFIQWSNGAQSECIHFEFDKVTVK
jgi:hypothetical protein